MNQRLATARVLRLRLRRGVCHGGSGPNFGVELATTSPQQRSIRRERHELRLGLRHDLPLCAPESPRDVTGWKATQRATDFSSAI